MSQRPHRLKLFNPWHSIFCSSDETAYVKLPRRFSFVVFKSVGEKSVFFFDFFFALS